MINSFKNPAIMRILRTTERHGAGWREQNFIPHDEATRLRTRCGTRDCGFFISQKERFYTSFTPVGSTNDAILHLILHQFIKSFLNEIAPTAVELWAQFFAFLRIFIQESSRNRYVLN